MSTIAFSGSTLGIKNHGDARGCMDSATHWIDETGRRSVSVVSDGAGSKSAIYSQKASQAYVESIKEFFQTLNFNVQDLTMHDVKTQILIVLNKTINVLFEKYKTDNPVYFSGTLLFVYVDRDAGIYFSGHIGDGYIIRIEKDSVQVESAPKNGEHSNQTYFVPEAIIDSKHLRINRGEISESLIGFMCMSDGLECLFPTDQNLQQFYKRNNYPSIVPVEPDLVAVFTYNGDILPILKQQFTECKMPNEKNKDIRRADDDVGLSVLRFDDRVSFMQISAKTEKERLALGREHVKKKKKTNIIQVILIILFILVLTIWIKGCNGTK